MMTGVVLLAGGMGSRLGHDGIKGSYEIGNKCLFQHHFDKLLKRTDIPVAVMTSSVTHEATIAFFQLHNFFNYPASQITFFTQEDAHCENLQGQKLLSTYPNGNGGFFQAFVKAGYLSKWARAKIDYVHVFGVDNILTIPADPKFVAAAQDQDVEICNKVICRTDFSEKVGIIHDKTYHVMEYINWPQDHHKYKFANIGQHLFKLSFLQRTCTVKLPKHKIFKANINGIKIEQFIFDIFPYTRKIGIFVVDRDKEFAPVKDESTAQKALAQYQRLTTGCPCLL